MGFFSGIGGALGSITGLGGGQNSGLNWRAGQANILQPTNNQQVSAAYDQTQGGLGSLQSLLAALHAQNGIQNQSQLYGQQQGLADQFQNIANGTGANPALAQLANTTGQNLQAQAALQAGQRGSSSNPGLMARNIAMQGGALQQQAVGQGAALQAQQQLAALSGLQNQQGLMGNTAQNQIGNQLQTTGAYNQFAQGEQQNLLNAMNNYNYTNVGMQGNINSANAGINNTAAQGQQAFIGGLFNTAGFGSKIGGGGGGAGGAAGGGGLGGSAGGAPLAIGYQGGMVPHYAQGDLVTPQAPSFSLGNFSSQIPDANKPGSFVGNYFANNSAPMGNRSADNSNPFTQMANSSSNPGAAAINQGTSNLGGGLASLLKSAFEKGGAVNKKPIVGEMLAARGKEVPGQASVKGDSLKNDTVPALLSAGEIVIPRHITQSANAPAMAAKFVAQVLRKHGMKGQK